MRQEMEKTVLKGRHGGWSIWLSVAFGMVWLLLLPGQSVARVPGSRDKQQNAETLRVVHGKVTDENGGGECLDKGDYGRSGYRCQRRLYLADKP